MKVDVDTGDEVPNEDIVRGYELDKGQYIEVTKEELENVPLESSRTIEIDEFVDRTEIGPRYLIRPYYLRPDGKVGHDAFAVIRETIREMNKVAIGRVVLTNRDHIIALEAMDKGLIGTLLRYPYEAIRPSISTRSRTPRSPRTCSILLGTSSSRIGQIRTRQVRGPVRNGARRAHQPQACRQADRAEGASAGRERRRPNGCVAQERRRTGSRD